MGPTSLSLWEFTLQVNSHNIWEASPGFCPLWYPALSSSLSLWHRDILAVKVRTMEQYRSPGNSLSQYFLVSGAWELVRNAVCQGPSQYWIRTCILTSSMGDFWVPQCLRSTDWGACPEIYPDFIDTLTESSYRTFTSCNFNHVGIERGWPGKGQEIIELGEMIAEAPIRIVCASVMEAEVNCDNRKNPGDAARMW